MAEASKRYDHPVYQARPVFGAQLSGNAGATKFAAFTDMLVKAFILKPTTAGTSNDTVTAYKVSGTTTTTHVLTTFGSDATAGTRVEGTFTLAQLDALSLVKGTDATGIVAVGVELAVIPRSNITA